MNFFLECKTTILICDYKLKCQKTRELWSNWNLGVFNNLGTTPVERIEKPGHPPLPNLISPLLVPKRKLGTKEGVASLIHALCHIEFNAINLALDACYHFQNMPLEYYANWLEVAHEESQHFELLNQSLIDMGYIYGSFDAHNGLWDMALKTDHDLMTRMALVPRTLEARGLDSLPEIIKKLEKLKYIELVAILTKIETDEIKHVQYGDQWFKYLCKKQNTEPSTTFLNLQKEYNAPKIRGAFNTDNRIKAGFSTTELEHLKPLPLKKIDPSSFLI